MAQRGANREGLAQEQIRWLSDGTGAYEVTNWNFRK